MSSHQNCLRTLGAFLASMLVGCSDDISSAKITVEGLPPEVDHIYACTRDDAGHYHYGRMPRSANPWSRADLQFNELPSHYTGSLKVLFEARTQDGCVLARDYSNLDFADGQAAAKLTLPVSPTNPLAERVCKVSFIACGIGRGSVSFRSAPPADGLAECPNDPADTGPPAEVAAYVKYGAPFQVGALAGANSHFVAWVDRCPEEQGLPVSPNADPENSPSLCAGQGENCTLSSVTGPVRLRAMFSLGLCTPTGFCWENPLPQGNSLVDVFSTADNQLTVAVGANGTVLMRDSHGWSQKDAGTARTLRGVSGSGASDVWTVGDGGAIRLFDGLSWQTPPGSTISSEQLNAVYAGSKGYVFVAGTNRTLLLGTLQDPQRPWNAANSKWATLSANIGMATADFSALSGTAPTRAFAASGAPLVHIFSGFGWNGLPGQPTPCGTQNLFSLWSDPSTTWLAGAQGTIMRFDGTNCTAETTNRTETLRDVFGFGTSRWAIGDKGLVLKQNGAAWSPVVATEQNNPFVPPYRLSGGTATSDNNFWIVGDSGVLLQGSANGVGPDPETQDPERLAAKQGPLLMNLNAVAGRSDSEIWAVGDRGAILRWDGRRWHEEDSHDDQARTLRGLWVGPTDVWAVGDSGVVLYRDRNRWQSVDSPEPLVSFKGVAATTTELWIVGDSGRVYVSPLNGGAPVFEKRFPNTSPKTYNAVWASGDSVCAVSSAPGTETNVLCGRGTGTRLVEYQETQTQATMYAIWGASPSDLWVAGEEMVLHRTGDDAKAWEKFGPYTGESFRAVGPGNGKLWTTGVGGVARVCQRSLGCSLAPTGTDRDLVGLWGASSGDLLVVGSGGAILRSRR